MENINHFEKSEDLIEKNIMTIVYNSIFVDQDHVL